MENLTKLKHELAELAAPTSLLAEIVNNINDELNKSHLSIKQAITMALAIDNIVLMSYVDQFIIRDISDGIDTWRTRCTVTVVLPNESMHKLTMIIRTVKSGLDNSPKASVLRHYVDSIDIKFLGR